eukprot:5119519-Pyramimonas_sp.AAC.1
MEHSLARTEVPHGTKRVIRGILKHQASRAQPQVTTALPNTSQPEQWELNLERDLSRIMEESNATHDVPERRSRSHSPRRQPTTSDTTPVPMQLDQQQTSASRTTITTVPQSVVSSGTIIKRDRASNPALDDCIIDLGHQRKSAKSTTDVSSATLPIADSVDPPAAPPALPPVGAPQHPRGAEPAISAQIPRDGEENESNVNDDSDLTRALQDILDQDDVREPQEEQEEILPIGDAEELFVQCLAHAAERS